MLEAAAGEVRLEDDADERMAEFDKLGIKLMLDVMHFGTPTWLKQAVGDPEFPEALERFTEALVSRYREQVKIWCPFNEPLVCALFSGDFGFWPPHSRKWRGYMPVLSRIVQARQPRHPRDPPRAARGDRPALRRRRKLQDTLCLTCRPKSAGATCAGSS